MPMLGREFGRLTVEELAGRGPRGSSWFCRCNCGNVVQLSTFQLTKGGYISCGKHTNWSEKTIPVPKELRRKHKLTLTSWKGILVRCHYNAGKTSKCYNGIEMCEEWFSFENFLTDMGPRPSINHSIDRKDPSKGYNKSNCQWLTKKENSSRIRRNLTPERNKAVSDGLKKAHAEGRIIITDETRAKIGKGGEKRKGRKLQECYKCGKPSYLIACQQCRRKSK